MTLHGSCVPCLFHVCHNYGVMTSAMIHGGTGYEYLGLLLGRITNKADWLVIYYHRTNQFPAIHCCLHKLWMPAIDSGKVRKPITVQTQRLHKCFVKLNHIDKWINGCNQHTVKRRTSRLPPHVPHNLHQPHYSDVIMGAIASQITNLKIVYSIVYSGADQRKYESSASLAFVRGIHRWPGNSPHKGPVMRKLIPFDDVIILGWATSFTLMEYKSTVSSLKTMTVASKCRF